MDRIIQGVRRFRADHFPGLKALFEKLAEGQHPHFLFITCSDSRIDPQLITQARPGDLFVLRNIGNIIPPHGWNQTEAEAVIEYAVAVLEVEHIILCGHSHCGAMKALLHPETLVNLPSVAGWLAHAEETRARVLQKYAHLTSDELLNAAIRENVLVQLERLRQMPVVAPRLADGRLQLHGWVYQIEAGDILTLDPQTDQFASLVAPAEGSMA